MRRIPTNAHDVVADFDGKMNELALVVHAFAADVFVFAVFCPGLLGVLHLSAAAMTPHFWQHCAEPVVEHARLELEADPEADGFVVHLGQEGQDVVSAQEAAFEIVDLAFGAKALVVDFDGFGQECVVGDDDLGIGHLVSILRLFSAILASRGEIKKEPENFPAPLTPRL
jgi:hypothetical protein